MGITYRDSGVDIDKGDRFVDIIRKKLKGGEQENIGLFGGLFELEQSTEQPDILLLASFQLLPDDIHKPVALIDIYSRISIGYPH